MTDQQWLPPGEASPVSGVLRSEAEDPRQAWRRVTTWLEQHRPVVFDALGGPGTEAAISEAEARMGVKLPREMRQWLLVNDTDAGRRPEVRSPLVALGCQDVLPSGGLLLGLTDIERVYRHKKDTEEMQPSPDREHPSWRKEWVPVSAETDGHYGIFLNTRTGTVGSWSRSSDPEEHEYPSLFAFFQDVADRLEGVSSGDWSGPGRARRLDRRHEDSPIRVWARTNGFLVNDRGRIPASVRQAYEDSL
ncbi:histone-like nucleoid-structuring protein Lsr2 [Actinacidiphila glaucinigra]|uniref:Lsr2 family DNA-binding protein n=1 Tax=Actinacidiphila glaucinigra TaxID=235986 RepID=UPI003795F877